MWSVHHVKATEEDDHTDHCVSSCMMSWSLAVCVLLGLVGRDTHSCRWSDGHGEGADGHTKCLLLMRVCMSLCTSWHGHAHTDDSAVCSSLHMSRHGHVHADDGVRHNMDLNTITAVQQAHHGMVADMLLS